MGVEGVGKPAKDGVPEPLQFDLNDGMRLMFIPRRGFGWVTGDHKVAGRGCVLLITDKHFHTDLNGKTVGKDFDHEFMEEQVDMHQETLDLLNDLDSKTTNADLKAAIAEAKPKVQAHLDQAKAIKGKVD